MNLKNLVLLIVLISVPLATALPVGPVVAMSEDVVLRDAPTSETFGGSHSLSSRQEGEEEVQYEARLFRGRIGGLKHSGSGKGGGLLHRSSSTKGDPAAAGAAAAGGSGRGSKIMNGAMMGMTAASILGAF